MARKRIRLPRLSARASASGVSSFNSGSARKAARGRHRDHIGTGLVGDPPLEIGRTLDHGRQFFGLDATPAALARRTPLARRASSMRGLGVRSQSAGPSARA
jgi:hypothetical protein